MTRARLQTKTALKRGGPLRPMSTDRQEELRAAGRLVPGSTFAAVTTASASKTAGRKPALPGAKAKTLAERSGRWCEIQLSDCAGLAVDPSHRKGTKSGGRHGDAVDAHARLSNVLHACRSCHDWLHQHPAAAKAEYIGWALEEWQEPTEWPVLYRGRVSWLTDDGRVLPYEEASA